MDSEAPEPRPSGLEKTLRVFADVRPGEGPTGILLLLVVFLVLSSYYFVKPLREGWLAVTEVGGLSKIQIKAYSSFAQSVILIGVVPLMAWLAGRLPRRTLLTLSTLIACACLVVFWFVRPVGDAPSGSMLGILFYLWVGAFGVMAVALSWAFAADLYSLNRGERLLPLVAVGASAGAAGGAWFSEHLVRMGLDTWDLLVAAIIPLLGALLFVHVVDRRGQTGVVRHPERRVEPAAPGEEGAFHLIFQNRYLLLAALLALTVNWVNTNGENILFAYLQDTLGDRVREAGLTDPEEIGRLLKAETTAFYGNLYFWVNLMALVLQAFFASRIVKFGGFVAILFLTPIVSLISYGMMAVFPAIALIKLLKIAENSSNYSLNNTARQLLWLPTSATMVYKAKTAIDTAFVRAGDALAAVTVLVLSAVLVRPLPALIGWNVMLVLGWLIIARMLSRENRRIVERGAGAADPA
ncbi:MAG TPA: hypothetical protein VKU85_13275 [bacterium]|nr:hypothetical protein [bacterium]